MKFAQISTPVFVFCFLHVLIFLFPERRASDQEDKWEPVPLEALQQPNQLPEGEEIVAEEVISQKIEKVKLRNWIKCSHFSDDFMLFFVFFWFRPNFVFLDIQKKFK